MKRNSLTLKIFKYNIMAIIMLILIVAVVFNIAVKIYIEKDITNQLQKIAQHAEETALKKAPRPPLPPELNIEYQSINSSSQEIIHYYFMLDKSLREPLTFLNANFILLDKDKNVVNPFPEGFFSPSKSILDEILKNISQKPLDKETFIQFNIAKTTYVAIIKPVLQENNLSLGWIVIYSSLKKVNQMQMIINLILFGVLIISAMIIVIFSNRLSKGISEPFDKLNKYIKEIAERNFGAKIQMPVYEELKNLVENINIMSEKLETHDKAQKVFLQNASHEFRTPLMSIQSYAEGIKYGIVGKEAADVIIEESKRLTQLVEDLLYLSRLDTIEESYHFDNIKLSDVINNCIERINGILLKSQVEINVNMNDNKDITIKADFEKLTRALVNILTNCVRYAKSKVSIDINVSNKQVKIVITDDGQGFDQKELPYIFDRFYKGKKGNFGLGLAITKSIVNKHNGDVTANNVENGAQFIILLPLT